MRADNALEGAEQRRNQQPHYSAVELARVTGIVALAEIEPHARMRHRITYPRQQLAVVSDDVAIVDRYHASRFACQNIPKTSPHVAPFSRRAWVQFRLIQLAKQGLHPGA